MTMREKIYKQIEELKSDLKRLEEEKEKIIIRMYEIKIEIGECEGHLIELDKIDGVLNNF